MASEIGKIVCRFETALTDANGDLVLSLRVPRDETYAARQAVAAMRTGLASGKERLTASFVWHKEKRSLNANSYFHVLVDKIATVMQLGADEVKKKMVLEYGTVATEGGEAIIVALPKSVQPETIYPYVRHMGEFTAKNGKRYCQYMLIKQTHTLDKEEMARLIDGVVYEAKELGIETRTPDEIAKMLSIWEGE